MSDEDVKEQVEQLQEAQQQLNKAIDSLKERKSAGEDIAGEMQEALSALGVMHDFVVRDLGTAVMNLRSVDENMQALGGYMGSHREAVNDLAATMAATVDLLIERSVLNGEELMQRKAKFITRAEMEEVEEEEDSDADKSKLN